jgi:hypothetical protein
MPMAENAIMITPIIIPNLALHAKWCTTNLLLTLTTMVDALSCIFPALIEGTTLKSCTWKKWWPVSFLVPMVRWWLLY